MTSSNHIPAIIDHVEVKEIAMSPVTQGSGSDEIEKKIKQVICEKLGLEERQLIPGISFGDGLGADSLDVFELMIEIENVFNINIPDEEAEKLRGPDTLITYIKKQKI